MVVICRVVLAFSLALLSGCVNPYAKWYQGADNGRSLPWYQATSEPVKIFTTDNFDRDVPAVVTKGYNVIGRSSFNAASNSVSERQIREQAEKVGAQIVLVSSRYSHTVSSAVPLTVPQNTTSFTSGTATAFGPAGTVNAYGNSTTTTYGTKTVMMPVAVSRSDFGAVYLAKSKTRLGIVSEPLDEQTRKRLESNLGVRVKLVIEGSPAYLGGVLPGDILLAISDDAVQSVDHLQRVLLPKYEGQTVTLKLDRDGKAVEKTLQLQAY
jgi:PDZ domain